MLLPRKLPRGIKRTCTLTGTRLPAYDFLNNIFRLPAGLRPPVFAGVARPPRPKAASPAKGLLPSLPICNNDEEIHRSNIRSRGQRIVALGCA